MLKPFVIKCIKPKTSKAFRAFSINPFPDIDVDYYCNKRNILEIERNINNRKGIGDINKVQKIFDLFKNTSSNDILYHDIKTDLYKELLNLPNKSHPVVETYKDTPRIVHQINQLKEFDNYKPLEFSEITTLLNLMRTDKLGNTCGTKSYYYLHELAELEEALIKYTVAVLMKNKFNLISVPDILSSNTLKSCGMMINNDRTQIYSLDPVHHGPDLYLSGTAEMSLAGLLANTIHLKENLPLKLAAVSRCFRAETSNITEERGTYRVHQFTKVEMFIVSLPEYSDQMLEYIRKIQEELFKPLGFHMKVLDMPAHELGAPAYRKYDIEAWMPGRKNYGEISSCSNCTDYQSRRLNIKCNNSNKENYAHTLNGTACAIPRMLITLLESHQDPKGKIHIPPILQPFMNGEGIILSRSHFETFFYLPYNFQKVSTSYLIYLKGSNTPVAPLVLHGVVDISDHFQNYVTCITYNIDPGYCMQYNIYIPIQHLEF